MLRPKQVALTKILVRLLKMVCSVYLSSLILMLFMVITISHSNCMSTDCDFALSPLPSTIRLCCMHFLYCHKEHRKKNKNGFNLALTAFFNQCYDDEIETAQRLL